MIAAETPSAATLPLELSLFGEFCIRKGEQTIELETPSYQSLLAYLVVHAEQAHSRQHLAFLLWPESTEKQARTNLRKAIYALRHSIPSADCYLQIKRQTLCWQPVEPVKVDVAAFMVAVARAQGAVDDPGRIAAQEDVANAYHGDFLAGLFDDWILTQREQWRESYHIALEELVAAHEERRDHPAAIQRARQLLRIDPLHEPTYRRLMRLYSLEGNLAGALQIYHSCVSRLKQELDVAPCAETQRAYERLLQRRVADGILSESRIPLVGRKAPWQELQNAWQQARSGASSVVLVQGEAGIGKTRLAEEMLDWARRQGLTVLDAACYQAEQKLAYAPVARWLRSETMQPRLGRLPAQLQVECGRLLPELRAQNPSLPAPRPMAEGWQRQHFFSALAQAILPACKPGLLFLDDLPWCDPDTLEWLQYLLHYASSSRFLLLVTARSEELTRDHPALVWQQLLLRDGHLSTVQLAGLDLDQTTQLASQVLQKELGHAQAANLYDETEGNPLFIVEMARAGNYATTSAATPGPLPQRVQSMIEGRLSELTPAAFQLAQTAATIGRSFTFPLLERAAEQSSDQLLISLDDLWRRRIIREQGSDTYDFSHGKIRQVAYASLSEAGRRHAHVSVARAMEEVYASNLEQASGQIAAHYDAAGKCGPAIHYYKRAADAAQAVYALQDAIGHLRRATELFRHAEADSGTQVEILAQLGQLLQTTGSLDEAEDTLQIALAKASSPLDTARLHCQLGQLWTQVRDFDAAERAMLQAEEALGHLSSRDDETWWEAWLQVQLERLLLYYWSVRDGDMLHMAETLRASFDTHGTLGQRGRFYQTLAMLSFRQHRYVLTAETIAYMQAALAAITETGDPYNEAFARFTLGFSYLWLGWHGDLAHAQVELRSALDLAERVGDPVMQCRSQTYLCVVHRRRGDVERVRACANGTLPLAKRLNMTEYVAMSLGQLAWVAWHEGDLARARELGEEAVIAAEAYPAPIPIQWPFLWPLVAVNVAEDDLSKAIGYVRMMLAPSHQRVHDDVLASLEQAVVAECEDKWDTVREHLVEALQQAQTHFYL